MSTMMLFKGKIFLAQTMFKLLSRGAILIVATVLTALIILYLWQAWEQIHLNRKIATLEEEIIPVRERNKQLHIQVIRTFSPERIERIAKERIGMVEPKITPDKETSE